VTGLYAECHCNGNITGPSCVECDPGYYGDSCTPCPLCVNGTCDQGYNATGKCECITWYSGHLCTVNYGHVLLYTMAPALGLFLFGALVFYWRKRRANILGPARTPEEKLLLSDSPSLNSPAFAGSPNAASSSSGGYRDP
jgi:hypothetical protein